MFTAELCAIANILKQRIHPSTDECIKKTWYKYRREYYSAVQKTEILPFAATWMDLEGIMISEINHKEKAKYCMMSIICGI